MDGRNGQTYREWSGRQWAGEDPAEDHDTTPHWTKDEWVGDRGAGVTTPHRDAADMQEGEGGLSGYRHTVPASHWVP